MCEWRQWFVSPLLCIGCACVSVSVLAPASSLVRSSSFKSSLKYQLLEASVGLVLSLSVYTNSIAQILLQTYKSWNLGKLKTWKSTILKILKMRKSEIRKIYNFEILISKKKPENPQLWNSENLEITPHKQV